MKNFIIKYRLTNGESQAWRKDVEAFIAAIERDTALKGKISYRCTKSAKSEDYFHIVSAEDAAADTLQTRDWFKAYSAKVREASGGSVEVVPLEILAQTDFRA